MGALALGGTLTHGVLLRTGSGNRAFQTIHISPAWFIPAVGNVVAPIAGVGLGFPETSWVFFAAGLIFWIVLLVLVMNRLIFHDPLPGRMVPTLAILIAPPAVGFLAWLQLNGGVLDGFARLLYAATLVFLGLALTQAGKLRRLPSRPVTLGAELSRGRADPRHAALWRADGERRASVGRAVRADRPVPDRGRAGACHPACHDTRRNLPPRMTPSPKPKELTHEETGTGRRRRP